MDRNHDAPATRFALEILRNHPQISYEHAVSAAEYSGVDPFPRRVFFEAAERLGIPREEGAEERVGETSAAIPSKLLMQLDRFRERLADTAATREALLRMQRVVRAALEEES